MTTLSPRGVERREYRPRRRGRAILHAVVLLLAVAFVASAGWWGWRTLNETPNSGAAACPQTQTTAGRAPKVVPPAQVSVNVYNTTTRPGLARNVGAQLNTRGFAVADVANDPQGQRVAGVAVIRYGTKASSRARTLAAHVPGVKFQRDPRRADLTLDLLLGARFARLGPAPAAVAGQPSALAC